MNRKIKLTAEQVKMIQQHKDKRIKISETQYNKLKNYVKPNTSNLSEDVDYKPTPDFFKPAEKLTRNFKKYGKKIDGFKAESENDLLGHPIGGAGNDEYNPQTPEENKKTFKNLNEGLTIELVEFTQHLLELLKEMLTDPSQAGLSTFWVKMGLTRGEMFSAMADVGIIGYSGHKLVVITKNLSKKIKRLYHAIMDDINSQQSEGVISLGDDIETFKEESNTPLGAEDDPMAPWNQNDELSEPKEPEEYVYDMLYCNEEMAIFKGRDDKLYHFNYIEVDKEEFEEYVEREEIFLGMDRDDSPEFEYGDFEVDCDVVDRYVNDNVDNIPISVGMNEAGKYDIELVLIDQEMALDLLGTYRNDKNYEKLKNILAPLINFKVNRKENVYSKGELIENKMNPNFRKLKDKNGRIRKLTKKDGNYRPAEGEEKCGNCIHFKDNKCKVIRGVIDKEMVCNYYDKKSDANETTTAGAAADGGSSGPYVTPKMWAKDKKNWGNGNKTAYPSGQIVQDPLKNENFEIKLTKEQFKLLKENFDKTQWPDGEFVEFDDCVKFNNNKKAENGGCSVGAADNVVKTKKTKDSVASKEGLYYEVAKKTGRSIDEVKFIIENKTPPNRSQRDSKCW